MDPQLLERLDALATKLGTTAEYLWRVSVQRELAFGVTGALATLLLAVVGLVLVTRQVSKAHAAADARQAARFTRDALRAEREKDAYGSPNYHRCSNLLDDLHDLNREPWPDLRCALAAAGWALCLAGFIVLVTTLPTLISPEGSALKTLLGK